MDLIIKITVELVIVTVVYLVGKYALPFFKTKIGTENLEIIASWVRTFVLAAEGMIDESGAGKIKYEYVAQAIAEKLKQYNIDLSDTDIKNLIESAVEQMNRENKKGE